MADYPRGETPLSQALFLDHARWEATLSDESVALQQDGGDGVGPSSWLWLARYCREAGLWVDRLRLRFRSHVVDAGPCGAPGYFYRPGVLGFAAGGTTRAAFAGHLDPATGAVQVVSWVLPDLTPHSSEWRDPADEKLVGPSLIRRPPH